jgi:ABC-type branched-subunit amino acid transport system substrate-binding protein
VLQLTRPNRLLSVRAMAGLTAGLFYASLVAFAVNTSFDGSSSPRDGGGVASLRTGGANDAVEGSTGVAAGQGESDATGSAGTTPASGRVAGSSGATSSGGAGASGAGASAGGSSGTGGTISIGVHDANTGAAGAQYGVNGLMGDQQALVRKVVDWINANGGMGGRKVELVYHITESLNGGFDQQAQEACTDLTEDHHVTAVISGAQTPTLNLVDCLARHNTPLIWDYHFMADQATFDKYANYLYMPSMVRTERLGVWMDALADSGYFKDGVVGIIRYDNPLHKHLVDDVLRPRLAARGIQIRDEAAFRGATGAASAADLSAQSNSTVLRFQSEGINRILFAPTSGVLPLLFMTAADSQGFHPRYSYTTYDIPAFQAENSGPSQLTGSVAFGWTPAGDVAGPQQPPLNPTAKRCVALTPDASPPANGSIRRYCNGLMFLKAVFDRGAAPTPASMRKVIESMGTSWESAWTLESTMTPARHDGASVGRLDAYDTGCSCYQYVGREYAID